MGSSIVVSNPLFVGTPMPRSLLAVDTKLKAKLDSNGIKDLVIVGAMSHMCVDATARAAADHGYTVTVVEDAAATRDAEFNGMTVPADHVHAAFMSALGFAYGKIVKADEYLSSGRPSGEV